MTSRHLTYVIAGLALAVSHACGSSKSGPGTNATITGTVAGTVIVAVDRHDNEVARVTATGSPKSFTLNVPAPGAYRLFFVENEGTASEAVSPLYQDSGNVFVISSAVTVDLGLVETASGKAFATNNPLSIAGVTSGGEDVSVPPSLVPAANHFPLHVGNRWIYTSLVGEDDHYRTDEIIGTETVQTSVAYVLERIEPAPDSYHEKRWLMYDASNVLAVKIWGNEGAEAGNELPLSPPWIHVKIRPQVGDTWTHTGGSSYEVLSIDNTVTVPAGTFTHCARVESPGKIAHYAPGVGLVRLENTSAHWVEELVYAKVGSQTYGVAPVVAP